MIVLQKKRYKPVLGARGELSGTLRNQRTGRWTKYTHLSEAYQFLFYARRACFSGLSGDMDSRIRDWVTKRLIP